MNFLEKYNIKINNTLLLSEALTHSSYAYENNINSYEKLEFLGDAILSVIVSEYLYNKHNFKEGQMTKIRAKSFWEGVTVSMIIQLLVYVWFKVI